jgi:hypothetical protein
MQPACSYSERVTQLLGDWALLAGQNGSIARDPRMTMLSEVLPSFDQQGPLRSALCADGSPVEFCERISALPQSPAVTVEPPQREGQSKLNALCRTLRGIGPQAAIDRLRRRLKRHEDRIQTYWIGVDFAQSRGARVYCHLHANAGAEAGSLAGVRLSAKLRRVASGLAENGALRLVASSFEARGKGAKLAFQHPLAPESLEALAAECYVPYGALSEYMAALDPHRGGWRQSRCGVALTVGGSGEVSSLTVYHYTAPYFRDDEQLRAFALRLAGRFHWNTHTYRGSSRLLDRPGERVRSLIGFTAAADGETSLRLYGGTGAYG